MDPICVPVYSGELQRGFYNGLGLFHQTPIPLIGRLWIENLQYYNCRLYQHLVLVRLYRQTSRRPMLSSHILLRTISTLLSSQIKDTVQSRLDLHNTPGGVFVRLCICLRKDGVLVPT